MSKYQNSFTIKRKMKYGLARKQFFNDEKSKLSILTPKERKIKELHSKFDRNEIREMLLSTDETLKKMKPDERKTHKSPSMNKIEFITKSSVFSDSKPHIKPPIQEAALDNRVLIHSSNLDWKKVNTEIMFSGDVKRERLSESAYQPIRMKLKQLDSHLNLKAKDYSKVNITKKSVDCKQQQIAEISKTYSNHFDKLKENISSLHSKDFYKKACEGKIIF